MHTELKVTFALLGVCLGNAPVFAADPGEGKAVAQVQCVQCHEADDWVGEDAASLESLMRDIVAGKVKHKTKIALTPAQIAAVAAYWEAGGKR
jgi:mono/diheme cytochrome c family protein